MINFLSLITVILLSSNAAAIDKTYNLVVPDTFPIGCDKRENFPSCTAQHISGRLAKLAKISINTHLLPIPRAIKSIVDKEYQIIMHNHHPKLLEHADLISPVFLTPLVLFTKDSDFMQALPRNKRVPVLRGVLHPELNAKLGTFTKVHMSNHEQMLQMFAKGRIDAVLGPEDYMLTALGRYGLNVGQLHQPIKLTPVKILLYCTKGSCDQQTKQKLLLAAQSITQQEVSQSLSQLGKYRYY